MKYIVWDTTALDSFLGVPGKCQHQTEVRAAYSASVSQQDRMFIPLAAIVECGNHIAHCIWGKRLLAQQLVRMVKDSIAGLSPFVPMRFWKKEQFSPIVDSLIENVVYGKGIGMGDTTILDDCRELCRKVHNSNAVSLLTYDQDMASFFESHKELWSKMP